MSHGWSGEADFPTSSGIVPTDSISSSPKNSKITRVKFLRQRNMRKYFLPVVGLLQMVGLGAYLSLGAPSTAFMPIVATMDDQSLISLAIETPARASLIITVAAAAWILWTMAIRPSSFWQSLQQFDGVPCMPHRHWLFGHAFSLLQTRHQQHDFVTHQQALNERHANAAGRTAFWVLTTRGIVLTAATDVRTVLRLESHKEPPRLASHHLSRLLGREQLGLLNGPKWKAHRSAITKSFTPTALRTLQVAVRTVIQNCVRTMEERIRATAKGAFEFDIAVLMKLIGIDALGLSSLSYSFDCCKTLEMHEFAESFSFVMGDVFRRMEDNPLRPDNLFYGLPTKTNREFCRHANIVRSLVRTIVQEHRQRRDSHSYRQQQLSMDLLDNLVLAHESAKERSGVSEDTLIDVTLTILFAGYDTVSNTMTYALYLITQELSVQTNILSEIAAVGMNDPDALVYIKACFDEALRLYPPGAVGNFRNLQRPVTLSSSEAGGDKLLLPKGTLVLLPFWTIHRNPANFERPHEFLPERWVRRDMKTGHWVGRSIEDKELAHSSQVPPANRSNFFGFSAGGRNCPGGKYATQEGILVLAHLISKFRFELVDPEYRLVPERHGPVQRPKGGIPMKIGLR